MAVTITSYTPETGPVTGGTQVTVTGTNLNTVTSVLVGNRMATIVGTPSPTSLTFRVPPGVATGTVKVSLFDGTNVVQATDSFTYTAPATLERLITTLASKFRLDVRVIGDANYTKTRGITTIKAGRDFSSEDDSDIDSGIDGEVLITGRTSNITGTVKRGKGISTGNYDPGQEIIRLAADAAGTAAGTIDIRWYDRTGGPEAYQAFALAEWSPQGGNKTADKVDFTLPIQGGRITIPNPVIADPTLADGFGS